VYFSTQPFSHVNGTLLKKGRPGHVGRKRHWNSWKQYSVRTQSYACPATVAAACWRSPASSSTPTWTGPLRYWETLPRPRSQTATIRTCWRSLPRPRQRVCHPERWRSQWSPLPPRQGRPTWIIRSLPPRHLWHRNPGRRGSRRGCSQHWPFTQAAPRTQLAPSQPGICGPGTPAGVCTTGVKRALTPEWAVITEKPSYLCTGLGIGGLWFSTSGARHAICSVQSPAIAGCQRQRSCSLAPSGFCGLQTSPGAVCDPYVKYTLPSGVARQGGLASLFPPGSRGPTTPAICGLVFRSMVLFYLSEELKVLLNMN
jgi:hypothetical protein